jgi:glycosyltransferase involved in cell wall biosynthesis
MRRGDDQDALVLLDEIPLSGVQALALLSLATLRAGACRIDAPGGSRRLPRRRMLAFALGAAAWAVPRELLTTLRLYRRVRKIVRSGPRLPSRPAAVDSAVYVRADPSLRWAGHLVGGASTHTSGVINGLSANGLDVAIVARERPAWTEGLHFTPVPLRRIFHLIPWLTSTQYGADIASVATARPASFVYERHTLGSFAGLDVASRLGVPLVLEYNGSELWARRNWGNEAHSRFQSLLAELEGRNLRSASLVVVVSDVLKEQLVQAGLDPRRVLVNPNGVDVERLREYEVRSAAEWRAQLALLDAPTVGFVGSFGVWHGVKLLPEMIERLADDEPDARWLLIGDGQLRAEVQAEIERLGLADRVTITGVVPHERALSLLSACDVCVSPHVANPDGSRFFGSPTKLFEYMGLGKAVVASDLEQIGEVIVDGESGLLHAPGDVRAAASAVAKLLRDPELRARLGDAALDHARRSYSWRAHVRRILDALYPEHHGRGAART